LVVRPFAPERLGSEGERTAVDAGRALRATEVVSGHFAREGSRLRVTVQAVDVAENRVVWQDTLSVEGDDLVGLREGLAARLRTGLLPALDAAAAVAGSQPTSQEAYGLYLRSLAIGRDPEPNRTAIATLERAAAIDPQFAPIWSELARREYYAGYYGVGGEQAFVRAEAAARRALAIDPDMVMAAGMLAQLRVESGDVAAAYDLGTELLARHAKSADSHFVLATALRYGGALEDSARVCERARALDSGYYGLRSCFITFMQLRRYPRAYDFVHLDGGSQWAATTTGFLLLREGKVAETVALWQPLPAGRRPADLLKASRANDGGRSLATLVERIVRETPRDPEACYVLGSLLAFLRQDEAALTLLRSAVEHGYCASTALDTDPLLAGLRGRPEMGPIRERASACRRAFDAHRAAAAR
jgi:hypothetical protein